MYMNTTPIKIPTCFFMGLDKSNCSYMRSKSNTKKLQRVQSLPDIKAYHKMLIKTVWYWHMNGQADQ